MTCPYCSYDGPRRAVHEHLFESHRSAVTIDTTETDDGPAVTLTVECPDCPDGVFNERLQRYREDATHIVEHHRDKLVMLTFDQLLYRLEDLRAD